MIEGTLYVTYIYRLVDKPNQPGKGNQGGGGSKTDENKTTHFPNPKSEEQPPIAYTKANQSTKLPAAGTKHMGGIDGYDKSRL